VRSGFLLALTLLLVALPATAGAQPRADASVVGGQPTAEGARPYAVALVVAGLPVSRGYFCGGTVVAPQVVVTAAHCVVGAEAGDFDVLAGRTNLRSGGGVRLPAARVTVHPSYDSSRTTNDIAVVHTAQQLPVTPLPLPSAEEDAILATVGSEMTVAGWGATEPDSSTIPDNLQETAVQGLEPARCTRPYRENFRRSVMVCAGQPPSGGAPDACTGDSGGPLVGGQAEDARLVGVVSYGGLRCATEGFPGVYTRVASMAPFLLESLAEPAPTAVPPRPASATGKPRVRIRSVSCRAFPCRVDLTVAGNLRGVVAIVVRVRKLGGEFDRLALASRVKGSRWRARILLPLGRVRISAFGLSPGGFVTGKADRRTVRVVE
jgi:secreted trypsin-like serine protease